MNFHGYHIKTTLYYTVLSDFGGFHDCGVHPNNNAKHPTARKVSKSAFFETFNIRVSCAISGTNFTHLRRQT